MDERRKSRDLSLRFGSSYFLYLAIYGLLSPYLQVILRKSGCTPAEVGFFLGLMELVGIMGPVYFSQKADLSGRFKPYLLLSGILTLVGLAFLAPGGNLAFITLSVIFLALGMKTPTPVLDAAIMKAIEGKTVEGGRYLNYGLLRSAGSVGFVLVTLATQVYPAFGDLPASVMVAAMAVLTFLYMAGLRFLPETGTKVKRKEKIRFTFSWIDSTFMTGLAVIALGRLSIAAIHSFFSLYLIEELGWNAVGGMWAIAAISEIPMMLLSWKFVKKKSPMDAIAIASAAMIVRLLFYAFVPTPVGAVCGQLLHSLCYGLFQPAAVAFVSIKTPPPERATGMAIFMSLGMGLPAFVGSILGGFAIERLGYRGLFILFSFFAAASLAVFFANKARLRTVR